MNKASIILLVLSALGLGSLIGMGFASSSQPETMSSKASDLDTAALKDISLGGAPLFRFIAPDDVTIERDEDGRAKPAAPAENFIARDRVWRSETVTVELPPGEATEYKAIMMQGDAVVFNWSTESGEIYYDFHGHDEAFGPEFYTRYDSGNGNAESGSIVAAYDGQHGWYWDNVADEAVTITLNVAGFFDEIVKFEINK
ncbi:MAG: hypothetical protein AB8G18_13710 [Gammaproteobacteria bacterium]